MQRLDPSSTLVLIVDVQERLAAAMPAERMRDATRAVTILCEASEALDMGMLATEQYPQGLGATIPEIASRLATRSTTVLSKVEFSAVDATGFAAAFTARAYRSVVVVGMEAHVCVFQTVRDLARRGIDVHVPIDGVVSRRDDHREVGIGLCRSAGATITTAETIAFDLLRRASGEAFKRISKAVR